MEMLQGKIRKEVKDKTELALSEPGMVKVQGMVQTVREMGGFTFVELRLRDGVVQCIIDAMTILEGADSIRDEYSVRCSAELVREQRAPDGLELHLRQVQVLSVPAAPRPIHLGRPVRKMNLETELSWRPISLRHEYYRSVFRIKAALLRGFREFLTAQGFVEINTPRIVLSGAEGGSNIFQLDYFNNKACLAQSPQLYKQMLVGVYQRVFEVGPVFRAEKHNTVRHLNEYTSLDLEMGFIDSFHDIMNMETALLQSMLELVAASCADDVDRLKLKLPDAESIPAVRFSEIREKISRVYGRKIRDPWDMEPEEEKLICEYIKKEHGCDFVFVTHYPTRKRPFYALEDPADPNYTLSFDLLFQGMEITTGGQRIHDYDQQVAKLKARGLDPEDFKSYLMIHRYGMPPHGGLGLGLERLVMMLLGQKNIRQAAMFPRDTGRLDP